MLYTLKDLESKVSKSNFPKYLLIFRCYDYEREVIKLNVQTYLDSMEVVICTFDELAEIEANSKLYNKLYERVIAQIDTDKQRGVFGYVWDLLTMTKEERKPTSSLHEYLNKNINEICDVLVHKGWVCAKKDEQLDAAARNRAQLLFADVMISGFVKFDATAKQIGK